MPSRRCSSVTFDAKARQKQRLFHRRVAAADHRNALPRKKNPSQVAQLETPCPISACSLGNPSQRALAPEAMISVRVMNLAARRVQLERMRAQFHPAQMRQLKVGAKSRRLLLHVVDQFRPLDPFRPAGKILDQRGDRELPARLVSLQHQRFQLGAGACKSRPSVRRSRSQESLYRVSLSWFPSRL